MPGEGKPFTSETASEAGRKSKRRPLDTQIQDFFLDFIAQKIRDGDKRTKLELMFEAAYKEFLKGNSKPLAYLVDRGFGKAKQAIELTGEDGGPIDSKITIEFVNSNNEIPRKT